MREFVTSNSHIKTVPGDWSVWFRYTYGVAGERFMREMDSGRLLGSVCPKCKRTFLPASLYCEDCFVEMSEQKPVAGDGAIHTFTVLHESLEETRLDKPVVIAFVKFEGVTGGWLAPLDGIPPEKVRIGLKVRPVFKKDKPSILNLSWAAA
jgi:uncharacterized OB-fold protein